MTAQCSGFCDALKAVSIRVSVSCLKSPISSAHEWICRFDAVDWLQQVLAAGCHSNDYDGTGSRLRCMS